MRIDPYQVPCPLCLAEPRQRCQRLSGPYAVGSELRRAHTARFRAAEARLIRLSRMRSGARGPGG